MKAVEIEDGNAEKHEHDDIAILGDMNQDIWIRSARQVSYASIAFTLIGGLVGIILSAITDSVSLLGYGLESFVDVWSSVLVLWRFWSTDSISQQKTTEFDKREQRASLGIAFTFVMIGMFVAVQAIIHIINEEREENADVLLTISAISVIVLSVLAAIKFRIARKLNSPSLYKDGVSSVAVALLSFGILLSTVTYDLNPDIWWLDDIVALLIALFLIIYGSISLYKGRKHASF